MLFAASVKWTAYVNGALDILSHSRVVFLCHCEQTLPEGMLSM